MIKVALPGVEQGATPATPLPSRLHVARTNPENWANACPARHGNNAPGGVSHTHGASRLLPRLRNVPRLLGPLGSVPDDRADHNLPTLCAVAGEARQPSAREDGAYPAAPRARRWGRARTGAPAPAGRAPACEQTGEGSAPAPACKRSSPVCCSRARRHPHPGAGRHRSSAAVARGPRPRFPGSTVRVSDGTVTECRRGPARRPIFV